MKGILTAIVNSKTGTYFDRTTQSHKAIISLNGKGIIVGEYGTELPLEAKWMMEERIWSGADR